jgi:hypothetical protein
MHQVAKGSRGGAEWVLRLAVAGACVAAAWSAWAYYSELNSLFYSKVGVSEAQTRSGDLVSALALLLCAALSLVGARSWWIGLAGLWFLLQAGAHTVSRGHALSELALLAHSARYLAPLALLLLAHGRARGAEGVLRWAAALTFTAHGVEALAHVPAFLDLLLLTARRFDLPGSEDQAAGLLNVIGVLDLAVAGLVLVRRFRGIALYMTVWGAVTLASRVSAGGLAQWPEALVRLPNAAAPAALYLLWRRGEGLRD